MSLASKDALAELEAARAALARAALTQAALAEITARLTSLREPSAVLQRTVDEAVRLLDAFGAALGRFDAEARVIRWAYHAGMDAPTSAALVGLDIPVGSGIVGRAFERREMVFTDGYADDPRFRHLRGTDDWIAMTGVQSMVAAPLPGEAGPLGILAIFSTRGAAFGPVERATFETLAHQAAIALENARRIEEIDRSRDELARRAEVERTLREIGSRLAALHDPAEILHRVVDEAARLVDADAVALDEIDPTTGRIRWTFPNGVEPALQALMPADHAVDVGLVGLALKEGGIVVTDDYLTEPRFSHFTEGDTFMRAAGIHSMVAAPLLGEGGPLGVVELYSRRVGAFGPAELAIIATFADQATIALANARRLEELTRSREELARSQERARLARELHDSVTQALFSMTLQTRAAELLLERDPAQAAQTLASLRDLQRDALAEMRSLIFELRPGGLAEEGLVHALRTHAAAIEGRIGLPVAFESAIEPEDQQVPLDVEEALYRIAQEALHNVVRHARATRVELSLAVGGGEARLRIADDGVGFDPSRVAPGHLGLDGMRLRAERLGGRLEIASGPDAGTRLTVALPLPEAAPG